MEIGSFGGGFVTGLREGVEAALIVSIILAYLVRTGHGADAGRIWLGVGSAVATSVVVGLALYLSVGALEEPYEQLFEGATMLLAAGVVTWMLFWMRRQAASVGRELRAAVDRALSEGSLWGLTVLAFVAVIREGIETSLFLVGQAHAAAVTGGAGAASVLLGALVGLAGAVLIGVAIYSGSRRIDLHAFFRWTGVALIFIAAGLVSVAVHEFIEAGLIGVGTAVAFDVSGILPHDPEGGNIVGVLLRAMFGYSARPEQATLAVWLAYLVLVLPTYLRPVRPTPPPAPTSVPEPSRS
jgi:high-affinity iron transporter